MTPPRECVLCGAPLDGRRADARFCSSVCRAEASRIRAVLDGKEPAGYVTLMDRFAAMRKLGKRLPVE
jgi:ferredoxin